MSRVSIVCVLLSAAALAAGCTSETAEAPAVSQGGWTGTSITGAPRPLGMGVTMVQPAPSSGSYALTPGLGVPPPPPPPQTAQPGWSSPAVPATGASCGAGGKACG